jgi:hypothetical protein
VDTKRLSLFLMGVRPGQGERHNQVEFAHCTRRPRDRAGDSEQTAILNGRQSAGAMGIELARRAEAGRVRVVPAPHTLAESPVIGATAFSDAMGWTPWQQHRTRRSDHSTPEPQDWAPATSQWFK